MKEKIKKGTSKILSIIFGIIPILIGIIVLSFYIAWREEHRHKEQPARYEEQHAEWEYFHSTIGQFKVLFPVYPEHKTHYLDMGKLDVYIAEQTDGTTYLAEVGEFSPEVDVSNPETFLKERLEEMLLIGDNELLSSNFITFDEYKALDFSIRNKKYNIISNGRMMIIEGRFYGLIGPGSKESEYNKFIDSFRLTK